VLNEAPEEEPEAAENELIEAALLARAVRLDDVTVTHYDVCVECCGKDDGITASGLQAVPGVTVAVDPAVIPLGSDVLVDYGDGNGLQYYRADDIGHGVDGNAIDLCVASHAEALRLGRRTATVYYVAPED
jgi:3D (Asp-Asp-Asp) domain-containing protein